jgi:ABC-type Mn2+/Zn2+ transport system ATPase subunit
MVPVRNQDAAPAVDLRGVSLGHGVDLALTEVDLRFEVGERIALIGPNGSGKTTLLHGIAGLLVPRTGVVRVFGAPPAQRRTQIAYVVQSARERLR